jgi:hypothetical protein
MPQIQVPTYQDLIEIFVERAVDWQLKFALWPQHCVRSNRLIWLRRAYRGTRVITGPGTPVIEHYWIDRDEFIIWNLKGKK